MGRWKGVLGRPTFPPVKDTRTKNRHSKECKNGFNLREETGMISKKDLWNKGYLQVYTGNGKDKTTAAFGLALRAAGADLRGFIARFVKGMKYSETEAFGRFADLLFLIE
jgi:ATP:corrinoid adenosyltransferase